MALMDVLFVFGTVGSGLLYAVLRPAVHRRAVGVSVPQINWLLPSMVVSRIWRYLARRAEKRIKAKGSRTSRLGKWWLKSRIYHAGKILRWGVPRSRTKVTYTDHSTFVDLAVKGRESGNVLVRKDTIEFWSGGESPTEVFSTKQRKFINNGGIKNHRGRTAQVREQYMPKQPPPEWAVDDKPARVVDDKPTNALGGAKGRP